MPKQILELLASGPATAKSLAARTGVTVQSVNRKLRALGESIVTLDKCRPPVYYAVTESFASGNAIPLAAVDPHGNTNLWGVLRPLSPGGFYLQTTPIAPSVLHGSKGNGFYEGLPYFLDDMRPQGFIGRQIARDLHAQSEQFPPDPRDWNYEHVGRYLAANGDDLPGNLKIGSMALDRVRRPPQKSRQEDYPELADKAVEGQVQGSSAGGEQPKFATYSKERAAHVIVKFSPKGHGELAIRWRDILITEYVASEVLHDNDIPAAELNLFELGDRLFLESLRFDRTGEHGRLPLISMQAIDNEFSGVGSGWIRVAQKLYDLKLITWQHLFDIAVYWGFGKLINNTDMHLGNIGFSIDGSGFSLAPVYDMCSMGFSPRSTGEIPPFSFVPPNIDTNLSFLKETCPMIKGMAREFWDKLRENEMVSDQFKQFLRQEGPLPACAGQ